MTESAFQPDRSSLRDHTSLEKKKEGEKEILFEKKTMILLAGLPASGKSTFAETHFPLDAIVSTDAIRGELSNNPGNQLMSEKAFIMAKRIIEERLKRGELVVFDAQNLSEDNRKQFYEIAARYDAPVEVIFFDIPPEETIRRDRSRKTHVGGDYIKTRRNAYRVALRSMEVSPHIRTVHVLKGDTAVSVTLPPEYDETLRADRALREEARMSAERLLRAEKDPSPEQGKTRHMIPVEAGSVVFFEGQTGAQESGMSAVERFTAANFLPDQMINAADVARRLATTVDDAAVRDIMQFILKCRTRNNLTTAVVYPDTFPSVDALQGVVRDHAAKVGVDIPMPRIRVHDAPTDQLVDARAAAESPQSPSFAIDLGRAELEEYGIDIVRNAPNDTPLFIVGDVHGCSHATHVLADRIREENRAARNGMQPPPPRTIVFIGDMADRGLYDADAVMYITALVRSGRAMLIRGNHDENLMRGLKGEAVKSGDTRQTIAALKKRLKPESIQKIIEMIEAAPLYAEWQRLVAVHAALPRIPRPGERIEEKDQKVMTHGARTGRFVGRAEVYKLQNTTAKDPGIVAVAGHTHEVEPIVDVASDTVNVDVSAQVMGRLYGMYYPERQFAYAEEPEVMALYRV
ncbi:AAA family ATPase, partial [Candidatus Uhrbacteria bacterium]|nr:AAA family ATPase [Candidatus Uhrbacteria bacterium]